MADLAVITPTRGRPTQFAELVQAVNATAGLDVEVWAGIDADDPALEWYGRVTAAERVHAHVGKRNTLSGWTNHLAELALTQPNPPRYLASLGDDHRPRTKGWDVELTDAIEDLGMPGIAYGNDLLQGQQLPTAWVVSAELVRAVGWMMLPVCEHMYVDTAIMTLGQASGRIVYRPNVIIEHLHPIAGKADWDASYRESNAQSRFNADREAFTEWQRNGGLASDVAKLRALVST